MKIKILIDTSIAGKPVKKGDVVPDCNEKDAKYLIAVKFAEAVKTTAKTAAKK